MSDQKEPEAFAYEDLDGAVGGAQHEFRERVSFSYGPTTGSAAPGGAVNGLSTSESARSTATGQISTGAFRALDRLDADTE
ncbi:MAG: hypothetical protein AAGH74_02380 [Pseudomonadota bacterium]